MSENASLTFLPYLRYGVNARPTVAPKVPGHRSVQVDMDVYMGGNYLLTHYHNVNLKGPGEVLGFTSNMVARTEPHNEDNSFEANYFPFVEFTEPDFPWRYSMAEDNGRVVPWLALVVLKRDEYEEQKPSAANLPVIKVTAPVLPDIGQLWAWAHVQLAGPVKDSSGNIIKPSETSKYMEDVRQYVRNRPALTCSRLMCPRQLSKLTLYTAFIVPAYEDGVLAGLGEAPQNSDNKAWTPGQTGIRLPVYYRWNFQTTEDGDFEELLDMLTVADKQDEIGKRPIDGSNPGYITDSYNRPVTFPGVTFYAEGALVAEGYMATGRDTSANVGISSNIIDDLRQTIGDPTMVSLQAGEDPLVSLPVYGRYYSDAKALVEPDVNGRWPANSDWLSELNMDMSYRFAASIGTTVVQENQEEFMKECWEQVGDINAANELLRLGSAGNHIGQSLNERHITPLDDHRYILATQPFHGQYDVQTSSKGHTSYKVGFKGSGLPAGVVSYSFRKIINKRIGMKNLGINDFLKPWSNDPNGPITPRTPDPDTSVFRNIAVQLLGVGRDDPYWTYFNNWNPGVPPLKPEVITAEPLVIGDENKPKPPPPDSLRGKLDITKSLLHAVSSLINLPNGQISNFNPIMKAPKINFAMSKYLLGKSIDVLIPNLSHMEKNTVTLLEQNNKFIEAYMAGLNHEMGRELIWRGFPTDQRGTVFNYFWDIFDYSKPEYDIKDISLWESGLGSHSGRIGVEKGNAVFVIKADLFRRYPNTILFALKVNKNHKDVKYDSVKGEYIVPWEDIFEKINSNKTSVDKYFSVVNPYSNTKVGDDTVFLFFPFAADRVTNDPENIYYFVIMQSSSLPRFGLDCTRDKSIEPLDNWDRLTWEDVGIFSDSQWVDVTALKPDVQNLNIAMANANLGKDFYLPLWCNDAAGAAWITYQKPLRIILEATDLV